MLGRMHMWRAMLWGTASQNSIFFSILWRIFCCMETPHHHHHHPCLNSSSRKSVTLPQYQWKAWTFRKCLRTPSQRQKHMKLDEMTCSWAHTVQKLLARALILRAQLLQARKPVRSLHFLSATRQCIMRTI